MTPIFAEIELINGCDQALVRAQILNSDQVRKLRVHARVAQKAMLMGITSKIQEVLQLPVIGKHLVQLTNNDVLECPVAGPLEVRFKTNFTCCNATVLPDKEGPILGGTPIQGMHLIIDLEGRTLIPNPRITSLPYLKFLT